MKKLNSYPLYLEYFRYFSNLLDGIKPKDLPTSIRDKNQVIDACAKLSVILSYAEVFDEIVSKIEEAVKQEWVKREKAIKEDIKQKLAEGKFDKIISVMAENIK